MTFEYLKRQNLIISRTKRAFEVKHYFLVSRVLSFRHTQQTQQTNKNVAATIINGGDFLLPEIFFRYKEYVKWILFIYGEGSGWVAVALYSKNAHPAESGNIYLEAI